VSSLSRWVRLLGVLLLALTVRLVAMGTTDLRDLPGPAGHQILAGAYADRHPVFVAGEGIIRLLMGALGEESAPIPERHFLLERVLVNLGGDHAVVLQVLILLGGLASVLGVMLAAEALAGRVAGLAGGTLTALWAPAVMGSLLVGDEQLAAGLVWGGLGLCFAGAVGSWRRLGLCVAGAFLVALGAQLRESVAPLVPLLLLVPLVPVSGRRSVSRRRTLATLGVVTAALSLTVLLYDLGGFRYATETARIGPGSVFAGLGTLVELTGGLGGDGLFLLLGLALVSAVVPGPSRPARALVGVVLLPMLGLAIAAGGELLRLRHVYQLAMPALVLVGCGVGIAWQAASGRWLRALQVALAVSVLSLVFDGLDLSRAWSDARVSHHHAWASTLPAAPPGWSRYQFGSQELNSLSVPAGAELIELAEVDRLVTVYLHDERQSLALVAALRGGGEVLLLEPRECCSGASGVRSNDGRREGQVGQGCARELLGHLQGRLLLPTEEGVTGLQIRDVDFVRALRREAGTPTRVGVDWEVWELQGTGETVCGSGARWIPDGGPPGSRTFR